MVEFLKAVRPDRVYLMVPTRPPAEEWVRAPSYGELARAYEVFSCELRGVGLCCWQATRGRASGLEAGAQRSLRGMYCAQ